MATQGSPLSSFREASKPTSEPDTGLLSCNRNQDADLQDGRVAGIVTGRSEHLATEQEVIMSKIQELTNSLSELSRDDLEFLIYRATSLLKSMRVVRIRRLYKRCGKDGCTCAKGALTDYGHGPYLYATWSTNGKQRQRSLGREYHDREFKRMAQTKLPSWFEKRFHVSNKQFDAMSKEHQWGCTEKALDDQEFLMLYNIAPEEDHVGRPRKLRYNRDKYKTALLKAQDSLTIGLNEFQHYGVGTLRGVLILRQMLSKGFHLAEKAEGDDYV